MIPMCLGRQYSPNKCQPADASPSWDTVQLQHSFGTPVVVVQVQTANNEEGTVPSGASQPWLTTAVDSVASSSFNVALESAETQVGPSCSPRDPRDRAS